MKIQIPGNELIPGDLICILKETTSSVAFGDTSRLRARSRFGSRCPPDIDSLPNRASRPGGEGKKWAFAAGLYPPHLSASRPPSPPRGRTFGNRSPFQRSAKWAFLTKPQRYGGTAGPPSSIRRASFARPRRIFAQGSPRPGAQNSFRSDFAPGNFRRNFSKIRKLVPPGQRSTQPHLQAAPINPAFSNKSRIYLKKKTARQRSVSTSIGNRTLVFAVRGRRLKPLDYGGMWLAN